MLENDPKIDKVLSPSTFNYHIRKLEKEKIIVALDKDAYRKGQKLFYSLTKSAQDKLQMGILKFSFNDDRDFKIQEKEEIAQQTFYKVLCVVKLTWVSSLVEPKQDEKEEMIRSKLLSITAELSGKHRKIKPIRYKKLVGVSVEDIINNMSALIAYWHVVPDRELVESALNFLKKEKLIKEHYLNNKNRYTLSKSIIGNFISDCIQIFFGVGQFKLRHTWQQIRTPTKLENEYFLLYFPSKDFSDQITFLKKTLKSNKEKLEKLRKENPEEYDKKKKKIIENEQFWDYQLYKSIKLLKQKHSKLFLKYPGIADVLFNIFFPKFLIRDIEAADKKYMKMNFPTLIVNSNRFGTLKIDPESRTHFL